MIKERKMIIEKNKKEIEKNIEKILSNEWKIARFLIKYKYNKIALFLIHKIYLKKYFLKFFKWKVYLVNKKTKKEILVWKNF